VKRRQWLTVLIGLLVAAATCSYPPRRERYGPQPGSHFWYYFDGWAWESGADIAWGTLFAEVFWVAIVVAAILWASTRRNR